MEACGGSVLVLRSGASIGGAYELVVPLQSGAMGAVWEARHRAEGRPVAIKFLHASLVGTRAEQRMHYEAEALSRFEHPAAARVFEVGRTADGVTFLVMELLRGRTLLDLLDERWRIEATEAVCLLLPIAGALASAHAAGVLHRDVKPSNVMLDEVTGSPKLIDFGLALLASAARITQDGVLVGTPAYVAPELARSGAAVDHRCDIWSFCVVLYHLVTGRIPFDGPGPIGILEAIRTATPTPTTALRAGDDALWAILQRGLQRAVEDRWPSMRELGRALARWALAHGATRDASGADLKRDWVER